MLLPRVHALPPTITFAVAATRRFQMPISADIFAAALDDAFYYFLFDCRR